MSSVSPKVTIQVVTWNSLTHIPTCLDAITAQTLQPLKVLLIDNASVDRTVRWIEEHYPQYHLLRNTRNTGFCHAHNQGFRINHSPYVLVLNPDVVLSPDWLERGVAFLDSHPDYGTFGGKILRYDYSKEELKSIVISDIIDSAGLQVHRNRHAVDIGSGLQDTGAFDNAHDVFGHSGACVLYRMEALEDIRYKEEFFDENFFAYKDDVDAAWRMQRMGWRSWYDPAAIAYHHRSVQGRDEHTNLGIAQTHRRRKRWMTELSYRNHALMLWKNETGETVWHDWPWMFWYEFRKIVFLIMTQPLSLRVFGRILRLLPSTRRKGRFLRAHQKVSAMTIRNLFFV